MGLFGWLLGRHHAPEAGHTEHTLRETDDEDRPPRPKFKRLRSCNFFGQFARSPNGKYALGWRDAPDVGNQGGHRDSGPGRFLLIEGDGENVVAEGSIARPNDGKVANNGTFILNDWGFASTLSGTFCAFAANGRTIVSATFDANLLNNGLSDDGRFAACHTCNSDDTEDSSIVAVFDLATGVEVGRWHAESGWPAFYEFDSTTETIGLGYRDVGVFRYSFTGSFIDRDKWVEASLTKGDFAQVLLMVERLLKEAAGRPAVDLVERLLFSIDRAMQLMGDDRRWEPLGWKLRGACFEAKAAPREALKAYENALRLNPKIGVKRRADQLRKLVRQGPSTPST